MDFIEIMDFCGYDMDRAHAMVKELKSREADRHGVDRLEPESNWQESRRLRGKSSGESARHRLGVCVYQDCCQRLCYGGYAIVR